METRKSSYFLLSLVTAGPGMVAVLVFAGIVYSELNIAPLFEGKYAGNYTTRVWSAPHAIRKGAALSQQELRRRLTRLGYRENDGPPPDPGTYWLNGEHVEVYLRGFKNPAARADPAHVEIFLDQGLVRAIRRIPGGAPLKQAVLEPELVFELSGDKLVRREPLALSDIPDQMKLAVVAVEDRRFYQHPGLDLRGVARAAVRNFHLNRVSEGGSTLTQQLARNLFLTNQRTWQRKAREALIAFYMESRLPKDKIMRLYLDRVYFGQKGPVSIVGLTAAARHFFNKKPKDLTLTECALLAGVVNSPRLFNPFEKPEAALKRRNVVLSAMRQAGTITQGQEDKAKTKPLGVTSTGQYEQREADYFVAYLSRVWERRYGSAAPLTAGLSIYTTLDPWLQEAAQRSVNQAKYEAALVALDPETGAIRALVGGKGFATSPFDRATQAQRQPGSSFKPFVYGAALEQGSRWTPSSVLLDSPKRYRKAGGYWTPKNYDGWYRGKVTLSAALAHSLNAASVRLAHEVGPEKIIEYARRLGVLSPLTADLGLALGTYEVNLLELTGAYCAFANGGFRVEPYAVEAAFDSDGGLVEERPPRRESVLPPAEAEAMRSLLRGVVLDGTAKGLKHWDLDGVAAGKTGTTDEGKDAWFIGFTPRIAAGVWTGSDLPTKLDASGATAAMPLWADFVRTAVHTEPVLKKPETPAAPSAEMPAAPAVAASTPQARMPDSAPEGEPETIPLPSERGVGGWLRRLFHKQ